MVLERAHVTSFSSTVHAVVIGVNRVSGEWLRTLQTPEKDAHQLAHDLTSPNGCALPTDQVICLTGPTAIRESVLEALRQTTAGLTSKDSLIFYFAGHGKADDSDFWLCTADTLNEAFANTAVGGRDLERLFATSACRGILVILDCCEGAAFSERAPETFRTLRKGEYRILMSAARADQSSWESIDGSGTLFSRALIDIVSGAVRTGNVPGAIYFSDLVRSIDAQVGEALLKLPGASSQQRQDMVFVGSYTREPLILVHRELSLEQVQFATARFSPAYVRRTLVRGLLMVVGVLFFILTALYGILDQTQYVEEDSKHLVVWRGNPNFNLPRYPHELWILPYGADNLSVGERDRTRFRIIAPLGKDVMPMVEARLRPGSRIWEYASSGHRKEARALAIHYLDSSNTSVADELSIHLAFPPVAEEQDIPLLQEWLSDVNGRSEVRLAALEAFMTLDPQKGFTAAKGVVDSDPSATQVDILRRMYGDCSPEKNAYLESLFDSPGSQPSNRLIYDTALRTSCSLSVNALLRSSLRPQSWANFDAVNFAQLEGEQESFAKLLINRINSGGQDDHWTRETLIGTLAAFPESPCLHFYSDLLKDSQPNSQIVGMVGAGVPPEKPRELA